jgi:hypothetical protein
MGDRYCETSKLRDKVYRIVSNHAKALINEFFVHVLCITKQLSLLDGSMSKFRTKNNYFFQTCGSDGVSYDNHCELHRTACVEGRPISPLHPGFCRLALTSSSWVLRVSSPLDPLVSAGKLTPPSLVLQVSSPPHPGF